MYISMEEVRVDVIVVLSKVLVLIFLQTSSVHSLESPEFVQPIKNLTVAVGREAILACLVENLSNFKVAWLRVDTQTILTIHHHVITKNHRIGVTHSELKTWYLHIKEVKETDKGWYMCQINTDPMKSQVGYLDVVVSPDILDYPTSADVVVDEGTDVSLRCVATGTPEPSITWKREGGQKIHLQTGHDVESVNGSVLNITKVKRDQMGPYFCIASNGVPPSVSKRIMLVVQFAPTVQTQYHLIGAYDNSQIVLECHCQAYPKSINYWSRAKGEIIPHNLKFVPTISESGYKVYMKLTIYSLGPQDYGTYKCVSKNALGEMEGSIKLYRLPDNLNNYLPSKEVLKTKNDVTYKLKTGDHADQSFHDNEYYSGAHRFTLLKAILLLPSHRVLLNFILFV